MDRLLAPGVGFAALEWAAKKGRKEIVDWLCIDERTLELVHLGCPIGSAGYTGQVDIMRYLKEWGADPMRTDYVLWGNTHPMMVAGQNGELGAIQFYVNECEQEVGMVDQHGKTLLDHIEGVTNWRVIPHHVASHKWVKKMLKGRQSNNHNGK